MQFDGFDWDAGNEAKCRKHGVSRAEIEGLFGGMPLIGPDVKHSTEETRFRAIGATKEERYLFVVFTLRRKENNVLIRPISARTMHKKEIASHEKEIP